jgi:hypothetical protein
LGQRVDGVAHFGRLPRHLSRVRVGGLVRELRRGARQSGHELVRGLQRRLRLGHDLRQN